MSADLTALIEKREGLENEIQVAMRCDQSLIISLLAAERGRCGSLSSEDELSIRSSVRSRSMDHLNSLEIDLERINAQISSLNPSAPIRH
jgi:hypothetical protein